MKRFRGIAALAAMLVLSAFFAGGCGKQPEEEVLTEPDRTGSWGQINQSLERSSQWRRIVTDSDFPLGEKKVQGQWELADGGVEEYYEQRYGSYPVMDGSTVAVPMAVEFARQHLGLSDEDAREFVHFGTTHNAYMNLISRFSTAYGGAILSERTFMESGKAVELIIATEPSEEEKAIAQSNGVELYMAPVCYDAFVFITHKDNPVESLTVEEIQKIYTGEITNWNQVGGDDAEIRAFQREANSGSQTAMEQMVMKGKEMAEPEMATVAVGMGALIDVVAEYQNDGASVGYTYKYYLDTLYKNDDVKVLAVEGTLPGPDSLRSQEYAFTTSYYGVIRSGDRERTAGRFLDWMLSEEGQQVIEQAGYVRL